MQSSSQIITTNKPTPRFLQARCPSCRPTNRNFRALRGNLKCLFILVIISIIITTTSRKTNKKTKMGHGDADGHDYEDNLMR